MAKYYHTEHIHPYSFDQVSFTLMKNPISRHIMFRLLRPYSRGTPTHSPATSCPRTPSTGRSSTGRLSTPGASLPRQIKSPSGERGGCQASGGLCLYLRRATWTLRTGPSQPTPEMLDSPTSCPPLRRWSIKPALKIPAILWP